MVVGVVDFNRFSSLRAVLGDRTFRVLCFVSLMWTVVAVGRPSLAVLCLNVL